jgi:hypothetical protein
MKILLAYSPAGAAGAAGPPRIYFLLFASEAGKKKQQKGLFLEGEALQTSHLAVYQQNAKNLYFIRKKI